ncbi:MAG: hypothetical protein V1930_07565 [Pseudomonadota bacterium]
MNDFRFMATGIGSVPTLDLQGACARILELIPGMPFWPQLVKRSPLEDMSIQFSERLPLLEVQKEKRSLRLSSGEWESELVTFYERLMAEDIEYFAVSRDYAPGLHEMVEAVKRSPARYGPYIKGQTVGPLTFAAGISGREGKSLLVDPEFRDAMVKGLAIKALWQSRELGKTGKRVILFLDEPYLSGFGSAFTPIQREEVIVILKEVIDYVKERSETLIGIHCCGNTDWAMLLESGPDIINFDAFSYMDYFLLYSKEILRFLERGGAIAWGVVPTAAFTGKESVEGLTLKLREGLDRLRQWGVDPGVVKAGSLLTPACGMGTMDRDSADRVLVLLSQLSTRCEELFP